MGICLMPTTRLLRIKKYDVSFHLLPSVAPESSAVPFVGGWNARITCSCPKPSVDIDGLELLLFTAFTLEIALTTRGIDGGYVI